MKEYKLLIISSVICVMNIIVAWFHDVLWSNFWILMLPIDLILILAIPIFFIISVIYVIKSPKKVHQYFSAFICLGTFLLILYFPFREVKTELEFNLFMNDRYKVISMIENNNLEIDELLHASLPLRYSYLSAGGKINIHQYGADKVISFYILRTVGGAIELVYSSNGEELIHKSDAYITEIKELSEHWYYVVSD